MLTDGTSHTDKSGWNFMKQSRVENILAWSLAALLVGFWWLSLFCKGEAPGIRGSLFDYIDYGGPVDDLDQSIGNTVVASIEAFRKQHQRLPTSLEEVQASGFSVPPPNWGEGTWYYYLKVGETYNLQVGGTHEGAWYYDPAEECWNFTD